MGAVPTTGGIPPHLPWGGACRRMSRKSCCGKKSSARRTTSQLWEGIQRLHQLALGGRLMRGLYARKTRCRKTHPHPWEEAVLSAAPEPARAPWRSRPASDCGSRSGSDAGSDSGSSSGFSLCGMGSIGRPPGGRDAVAAVPLRRSVHCGRRLFRRCTAGGSSPEGDGGSAGGCAAGDEFCCRRKRPRHCFLPAGAAKPSAP